MAAPDNYWTGFSMPLASQTPKIVQAAANQVVAALEDLGWELTDGRQYLIKKLETTVRLPSLINRPTHVTIVFDHVYNLASILLKDGVEGADVAAKTMLKTIAYHVTLERSDAYGGAQPRWSNKEGWSEVDDVDTSAADIQNALLEAAKVMGRKHIPISEGKTKK